MKNNYKDKVEYSIPALREIEKNNLQELINGKEYSKTLDVALASGEYKNDYYKEYIEIEYFETKEFIKEINVFLDKKYTSDEINNIYKNFTMGNIGKLLNVDYLNLSDYFSIKNFDTDNYERYVNWDKDKNIPLETVVTYVNIGLDKDFYTFYDEIKEIDSYTVLINKYHKLPDNYEPNDLVSLSYNNTYKLRHEAALNFEKLVVDAKENGHYIAPYSAYRTFKRQQELYTSYVNRDGKDIADTYSARAGYSEHQSGLAVDITTIGNINELSPSDYKWVYENAYKYGFIIRYPEDKTHITGYMYERWHLRFVGIEIASDFVSKEITYDEYYDLYLKK